MPYAENARANLKALVEAYGAATGRSVQSISKTLYGNTGWFLPLFFAGKKTTTLANLDRMIAKLLAEWPPGVPLPAWQKIERPRRPAKIIPR